MALGLAACAPSAVTLPGDGECPAGMALIPAGSVRVPDAWHHTAPIEVHRFCMDRTDVTVRAYQECRAAGRCTPSGSPNDEKRAGACNEGKPERADHPINCVDWLQAATYCAAHDKRLPDEDEWLYAAFGGAAAAKYPWGDHEPAMQLCWSGITPRSSTCPAGGLPQGANPWGVLDLQGNVQQWTSTSGARFARDVEGDLRLTQGSAWNSTRVEFVETKDVSHIISARSRRDPGLGFRCVRSP
jgi:formylglycine-generating enzyme required for sulfatase activity